MPPYPTRNITGLLAQGGDPRAQLQLSGQQSQQVAQSVPSIQRFGEALYNMLKQQQQLGTRPLKEQELNAQTLQAQRLQQQTPSELIGAAPSIQESARSAEVAAVQPTITGAQKSQQTFAEQIKGFGDTITATRQFLTDFESRGNKARDDARSVIKDAFAIGGADSLKGLDPEEMSVLEKNAGYPKGYIQGVSQTLKERELELKRQNAALTGGLTAGQINTTINQIRGAFDNEPIVKEYNVISGQVQFTRTATKTPTDDISRIYVFAKVMDPTSAVKEGEYATVQEYATTLLQRYGLRGVRIFNNKGFLTDEARKFLQDTLERRLKVSELQYNNIAKEYQRQIDDARAGRTPTITQYQIPEANDKNNWEYIPDQSFPSAPSKGGERLGRIFG